MNESYEMTVNFKGLTTPQIIALSNMFKTMEFNGRIGHSEWVGFYSDGDGNFNPKIEIMHTAPDYPDKETEDFLILFEQEARKDTVITGKDSTLLDFDNIAWLHKGNASVKRSFLDKYKGNGVVETYLQKHGYDGPVKINKED